MTLCPCGCGLSPKPGKRWIHGHTFKMVNATTPHEERSRRGRKGAKAKTKKQWRAWGLKGGRAPLMERWAPMLAIWRTQGPRAAIRLAYAAGYDARKQRERKRERRVA